VRVEIWGKGDFAHMRLAEDAALYDVSTRLFLRKR
jgi:hypothetical protein